MSLMPDPSPEALLKYHLTMMVVWAVLVVPTMLFWKESILWVAFMSLYANFVGHFSGYDATRAELNNETVKELRALKLEVKELRETLEA